MAAANNIFALGGVDVWFKVLLSLLRLVLGIAMEKPNLF